MPSENQSNDLPPKYYLNYYHQLLLFIKVKYKGIVSDKEQNFIKAFENCSENAQCYFVRFLNRKGLFFRIPKLNYPEIEKPELAILELQEKRFISKLSIEHEDQFIDLISIYTKSELLKLVSYIGQDIKILKKLNKEQLLLTINETVSFDEVLQYLNNFDEVICQNYAAETEMIRFLYFGSLYGDMSRFVVKDLGHLQFEDYDFDQMTPYFRTRKEAEDKYMVSKMREQFALLKDMLSHEEFYIVFAEWAKKQIDLEDQAKLSFERLLLHVARDLERAKLNEEALEIYQLTDMPPSRERQVRILQKEKEIEKAVFISRLILDSPYNAKEEVFAFDFLNKLENKKSKKTVTSFLEQSETIFIDEKYKYNVELGVLEYYFSKGKNGFFSENYIWLSIFGLIFWDIIFDQKEGGIHNPFQSATAELYHPNFFIDKKSKLRYRLSKLNNLHDFDYQVNKTYEDKKGIANHFVNWQDEELLDRINAFYHAIGGKAIKATLMEMTKNLKEHRKGLPDLFIYDDQSYSFIEVKSPNDKLSEQQVFWLKFFEKNKINAKVIRVKWIEGDE